MKTSDLIAREAMDKRYGIGTDWEEPNEYGEEGFTRAQAESDIGADEILGVIREAIEADRAQRAGRLEDLHAYDYTDPDDQRERILIVQIDALEDIGRMRVYINDGRIYDGDPETGQEWSLT